jgi:hypothetical protein
MTTAVASALRRLLAPYVPAPTPPTNFGRGGGTIRLSGVPSENVTITGIAPSASVIVNGTPWQYRDRAWHAPEEGTIVSKEPS